LTGIPLEIIKGYWILYICLASRRLDVCPIKFRRFANNLREKWKEAVGFYPWCVSMHHWEQHAPEIMEIMPATICIAMLSEVKIVEY
jgi:hypothetical protein